EANSQDGLLTFARAYGGQMGVGALAVASLVMMVMMVRRAGEGPVLPGEEPPALKGRRDRRRESVLVASTAPIGEADESEPLLVAKEVDEQTLRTQQVVEQVVDLVKDDPQNSVQILQRWIDSDRT